MKWLLFIATAIGLLVLLVALIGLMLPKAHRATRMARFKQPPEVIFAAITGPQDWRAGVTRQQLEDEGGVKKWRDVTSHGTINFEEVASEPPRFYRSRIADKNLPFGGTWTWEIAATEDGCTCRITEDGEVYNPVFRFVGRFVIGYQKTIEDYLKELGKKFGKTVVIEN